MVGGSERKGSQRYREGTLVKHIAPVLSRGADCVGRTVSKIKLVIRSSLLIIAGILFSAHSNAQTEVCFYDEPDFVDLLFCTLDDNPDLDSQYFNRTESIYIPTGYEIQLFANDSYSGISVTKYSSDNYLTFLERQFRSYQITGQAIPDDDNDGVENSQDSCPNTPLGEPVDANGCALSQLDTDADGVTDDLDQCPGTPAGATVDVNGCSPDQIDTDGDGTPDYLDSYPYQSTTQCTP